MSQPQIDNRDALIADFYSREQFRRTGPSYP
jgi:hypothetical protein